MLARGKRQAIAIALLAVASPSLAQMEAGRTSVAIATASTTGNYFLSGNAVCRALTRQGHVLDSGDFTLIDCGAVATAGSIANVDLLRNRSVDVALVQSDWAHHAYRGKNRFAGRPMPQLRLLFKLNAEAFQVVAGRSTSIGTWNDLKGKKVNLGPAGATSNSMFQELLSVHKQTEAWFTQALTLSPGEHVQELCEGNIEAFGQTSGVPNPGVRDAMRRCGATLVALDTPEIQAMMAARPYLVPNLIPKRTYPGQLVDIPTFAVTATMLATADLPDSIAYSITMAAIDALPSMQAAVPVLAGLTPAEMASGTPVVPWHRGAVRAFREAGIRVIEQTEATSALVTKPVIAPAQTDTALPKAEAIVTPPAKQAVEFSPPLPIATPPLVPQSKAVLSGPRGTQTQKRGASSMTTPRVIAQ